MKRNNIGSRMDFVSFRQDVPFIMNADNTLSIALFGDTSRTTNRTFEDTSKWYHFVLRVDSSQSTADDRIRLYVDGDQITSFSTTNNPYKMKRQIYTLSRGILFLEIFMVVLIIQMLTLLKLIMLMVKAMVQIHLV